MTTYSINLSDTESRTPPVDVTSHNRVSIQVSASTWGAAVAELKWSLGGDIDQWDSFSTAVQLSTSTTGKQAVNVDGVKFVRLETTTEASGASTATVELVLYNVKV